MAFARLVQFLLELVRGEFHGNVTIQFRKGQVCIVRKEETFAIDINPLSLPVKDEQAVALMQTGKIAAIA